MNKRKDRVSGKQIIQGGELRQSRIRWCRGRMVAMQNDRHYIHHSPHRDRDSDHRQKNDAVPNRPLPPNTRLHTYYYA